MIRSIASILTAVLFSLLFAAGCGDDDNDTGTTDTDTDTDTDSDTDADSDTDTDSDTDADSGTDTDTDTGSAEWQQQAYLKASNAEAGDGFGYSLAISGDTLVVGAYSEDSSAIGADGDQSDNATSRSGAVYVFVRSGDTWSLEAYLKASNTHAFDSFGHAVAIHGDTLVVGAIGEDSGAMGVDGDQSADYYYDSGAVYVFVRSGGAWSQQAYVKASNTGPYDAFGYSVAISGDTLAVGAIGEDGGSTGVNGDQENNIAGGGSGAVYVFARSGDTWSQQAYLKASNTEAEDDFGRSVAVSDDTLVVGARLESSSSAGVNGEQSNNDALRSGAAYVFVRNDGAWSQQAYLKSSNTEADDWFGNSVSVSGDTVVIGANRECSSAVGVNGEQSDNGAHGSGAAYVFVRSGDAWSQQDYLKASNTDAEDWFGHLVAVSEGTVAIGANWESSNATGVDGDQSNNDAHGSGAAYVFKAVEP